MKERNQALGWLCLCYPATPPAFVAGVESCVGHREYLVGAGLFYALLLFALWRCARSSGRAGWAFATALIATLIHLGAAWQMVFGHRSQEALIIQTIFAVAMLTGLGGAQLAYQQERKLMALLFLGSCAGLGVALCHYGSPLDDPRMFLASFFFQAALFFFLRLNAPPAEEGTGFIQSET